MAEDLEKRTRLIGNRPAAVIAALSTGLVTALAIRSAFVSPVQSYNWLLPLFLPLPHWALPAAQVLFYGYLLGLCVLFFRIALGKERLVVMAWALAIFLNPLETILPTAANQLELVSALGMAAALLVTVDILLRQFSSESPQNSTSPPLSPQC